MIKYRFSRVCHLLIVLGTTYLSQYSCLALIPSSRLCNIVPSHQFTTSSLHRQICSIHDGRRRCDVKLNAAAIRGDDDDERQPLVMLEENDAPRISIKDDEPVQKKNIPSSSSSSTSSPYLSSSSRSNDKPKVSATFGSMSIEDLKSRMKTREVIAEPGKWDLPQKKEDLNGINPITPLVFSAVPAAMAYVGWQVSHYLTATFAIQYVNSEIYPVQRIAIVARNVVVGITTLATGFSGVVSLGLFLLGITVAIRVIKGELDPKAELESTNNSEKEQNGNVKDLMKDKFNDKNKGWW